METKKCTKCGKVRDINEFYVRGEDKNKFRSACKQCCSLKENIYRTNNKERISERSKEYYKQNKEQILRYQKHYCKNNPEKVKASRDKHYNNNKEKYSKIHKEYRASRKKQISRYHKQRYKKHKIEINDRINNYRYKNAEYLTYKGKLTVDELPRLAVDKKSLEVKCRYCGEYFIPNNLITVRRIQALNGTMEGECSLYCSDNCKSACPIYGQIKYPKNHKKASSREVNPLIRQMCFERDNWVCQICGVTQRDVPLHCHHVEGVAQNPRLSNDVKNTITLCKVCHKEVHKLPGCNYYELRCNK